VTSTAGSAQYTEPAHTGVTNADWAVWVLQDAGYPTTVNNVNNLLSWMAAENNPTTWWGTAGANNPLNNGLGSGGGNGTGSYPDLATAAQYAAQGIEGGIAGAAPIGAALAADAPFSVFHAATISSNWSGAHYNGTGWAAATSPLSVPIVEAGTKAVVGSSDAAGSAIQGAASSAANAASSAADIYGSLGNLLSDITSAAFWERIGVGVLGLTLVVIGLTGFISTTKPGQEAKTAAAGAVKDAATAAVVA
jgi:hypothetical protein